MSLGGVPSGPCVDRPVPTVPNSGVQSPSVKVVKVANQRSVALRSLAGQSRDEVPEGLPEMSHEHLRQTRVSQQQRATLTRPPK
eukprot:gene2849-biopygen11704